MFDNGLCGTFYQKMVQHDWLAGSRYRKQYPSKNSARSSFFVLSPIPTPMFIPFDLIFCFAVQLVDGARKKLHKIPYYEMKTRVHVVILL